MGEADSYAWSANAGWLELTPHRASYGDGVRVSDRFLSGYAWSDSTGWIHFGNGPANLMTYRNDSNTDYGVNHDGLGNLSGLAWSANTGWINFGWATPADPNRPRFSLLNGVFTGCAWSPNLGWISLETGILKTDLMTIPDTDGDGISDSWEMARARNLTTLNGTADGDGDGVTDKDEFFADTDPLNVTDYFDILAYEPGNTSSLLTWTSRPTRLYRIFSTTDLERWTASVLNNILPDAGASTTRTTPHPAGPRRLFRVDAVLPLQP